jgi:DNA uptake protein ComE-like DNA-binding protein
MIAATVFALTLSAYGQTGAAAKNTAKTTTKSAASKPTDTKAATAGLLDINSATAAELDALPGIGKAYSKKIIDGRPYANKSQLVSKGIMPESVYKKIQDKIIAKQK